MPTTKEIHRPLALVSPRPKGPDVHAVQGSTNKLYAHYKIDRQIEVDGVLGPETLDAVHDIAVAHGVVGAAQDKLEHRVISESVQRLIRGRTRSAEEVAAAGRRGDYRLHLRKRYDLAPGVRAIQLSNDLVGITESPPGSNKGGVITEMEVFTGYTYVADADEGVWWCGCAACWIVVKLGGANIPDRQRLGFAPYITEDALAHRNGLRAVKVSQARPGDIGCLWGGDHVVTVRAAVKPGDTMVKTREGNTSPGNSGEQANGGGLFDRERPISDFDRGIVARPDWA